MARNVRTHLASANEVDTNLTTAVAGMGVNTADKEEDHVMDDNENNEESKELSRIESRHALTKQEFARKLYDLIMARGWNQSELARRAGVGRDAISTYIRGRSFPEPRTLKRLAEALDMKTEDLLPNSVISAVEQDEPALCIQESPGHPDKCWIKVNRMVTANQAMRIMQIVHETDGDADPSR